ncbi:MAG TPA: glycosyltransferase family 4 protein [Stellaceae bacterium]|nr:glycosyltransferase family 4 protein [Stellaceae bacterium]
MASVVMADDGIPFDGATAETRPLGGAETAFVALAEALAARGHRVAARSRCAGPLRHNEVDWAPVDAAVPQSCDLYIGNRGPRMIGLLPSPRRRLLWLHNPARYLKKPRMAARIAWYRPVIVTTGAYHASTVPAWLPCGGRVVIPYGVLERFRHAGPREPPPPRAVFTSNPQRGLDWLLDLWVARIRPAVPQAELHIYAGAAVYGGARAGSIEPILARAEALAEHGVRRHAPVGREALIEVLTGARAMLYRGDPGETFCLALAEAQALGVPAVVTPLGAVAERVADGASGCVAASDDAFVEAAIAVLRDDALWRRWHRGALATQRGLSWDDVAQRYEALLG